MPRTDADLARRFRAITHKLWGKEEGEQIHQWIVKTRPPSFHAKLIQVMVPVWELDKVDLKTKILCAIALFTGRHMREVEFFFKMAAHHKIPREHCEEILILAGLEAGFPAAEMAIEILKKVYDEHAAKVKSRRRKK
jgi:alkylhydroperoxidase/carboxymuconolactone decarboxylase family protein YurZ